MFFLLLPRRRQTACFRPRFCELATPGRSRKRLQVANFVDARGLGTELQAGRIAWYSTGAARCVQHSPHEQLIAVPYGDTCVEQRRGRQPCPLLCGRVVGRSVACWLVAWPAGIAAPDQKLPTCP